MSEWKHATTSSHPHFYVPDKASKWGQIVVKVGPSPQLMRFPLWTHAPWLDLSVHHRSCKCKWISLSTPNYWIFVAAQHKLCGHHHFLNVLLVVLISVLTLSLVLFWNEHDIQHHNLNIILNANTTGFTVNTKYILFSQVKLILTEF